jgi:hypothetical protein
MEILERDIATKTTEYMFSMMFSNLDKHQPWSLGITIMRTGPGKHHTALFHHSAAARSHGTQIWARHKVARQRVSRAVAIPEAVAMASE